MNDNFRTIKNQSEGIFKDKGSKFLAFAFPVETEDEVNQHRAELKKKYFDARHHVYAFQLGTEQFVYRSSDDGEPSNSSGPPVLGQIRSFELTNILVVVVRYFGGTKLGVPGLINAYKSAASDALNNAEIVEKFIELPLIIKFEYPDMNEVMRHTKLDGIRISKQEFEMHCLLELRIRKSIYGQVVDIYEKMHKVEIEK